MASFDVVSMTMLPDARPDGLGEGVVWSLTRSFDVITQSRPRRAFLDAVLTLGIFPAIEFPKSWRDFLYLERDQFESMVDWLDRTSPGDARRRVFPWKRARRARSSASALIRPVVVALVVVLMCLHWWVWAGIVWNVALSVLFFRLASEMRHAHRADVRWAVRRVHAAAREVGLTVHLIETDGKVVLERHWLLVGIAMALLGQPWGMAYALAGQLRRRAVRDDGQAVRAAMARACRQIYLARHPGAAPPGPGRLADA